MPNPEDLKVLRKEIKADLEDVEELMGELAEFRLRLTKCPEPRDLSHVGYLLHSIYTAWESALHRIAVTFENRLSPGQWHKELLQRMALDLTPIRPAVLDTSVSEHLEELRSFRHFFRHNYGRRLRLDKMEMVLKAYDAVAAQVGDSLRRFLETIERIADQAEEPPL